MSLPPKERAEIVAHAHGMAAKPADRKMLGCMVCTTEAAFQYAKIAAARKFSGRPISRFDAMIASIARLHGASVATRNTSDFHNCGIDVIKPRSS